MATVAEALDAANFYYRSRNLRSTDAICRKILQQEPDRPEALNLLGAVACQVGDLERAIASISRAIELNPRQPDFYCNLAESYKRLGKPDRAIAAFRQALELQPDAVEGYKGLGDLLFEEGNFNEAQNCYQKWMQLEPNSAIVRFKLGLLAKERGKIEEAIPLYEQALQLQPNFVDAYNYLGQAFICQGKFEEAIALHQKALALQPDCLDAIISLAGIYERQRQFDRAEALLRPAIEAGTDHAGIIHAFAVLCQHQKKPADAIEPLKQRLSRGDLTASHRRAFLFTLADSYDASGNFDLAFDCYRQANDLKPMTFDPGPTARAIANIKNTFTREGLAGFATASNSSQLPIFIVGMPRSGTSLAEQILASHPRVFGAGERSALHQLAKQIGPSLGSQVRYPRCLDSLNVLAADRIASEYLQMLQSLAPDASFVTDKMPSNFLHLGLIQLLFPGAKIIHCVRHPLDTCLSCYFQDFLGTHAYAYDLNSLGTFYQLYWDLMAHWQQALSLPIFELRYEELVTEPESKIRNLVEFCGLEWDDACLRFHQSDRHIPTASYHQVQQPIYTKSVARYKNYDRYLDVLKSSLGNMSIAFE
ncbi:sulfotransferase [Oscillatoriales cyanobacterium LEGE 11467]|uniref:Sulfotransferase n=1 Tax=Zarconia navalis LEGE 11467 TaxID=1828826 RepID=A0A928VZW9_9CYAN|nr:tetratricopeptide repeat-containing sulfotransferase family protein [Zarconia navalis]MBE9042689.1 sulfotransferase [Zarconia navalis LEGE 11467]